MTRNILLLCENENSAQLDRRFLRECGFNKIQVMTSGIEAARLLAREDRGGFDLAVLHDRLEDMGHDQFYAIIRSHPRLQNFPLLLIPANADDAGVELGGKDFYDIIQRPFSLDALRKKTGTLLLRSARAEDGNPAQEGADTEAFEKALASYGLLLREERSTDEYFHMGMDFLKERNWSLAVSAFQKSVQDHRLKAEAELGMAAAYKGHNDLINFRQALASAAESFVRNGRWNRGRSAYARLLQHDKSAKNPFLTEAQRHIKRGDYAAAANIIKESMPLIPKALAGVKLARLCYAAPDSGAMLKALEESLDSDGMALIRAETSAGLEKLNREKEERERQKNAERKWELGRIAKARLEADKEAAERRPELRMEEKILPLDGGGDIGGSYDNEPEDYEGGGDEADRAYLAPLVKTEGGSDLLSVIKLTWKLARRSKNKP